MIHTQQAHCAVAQRGRGLKTMDPITFEKTKILSNLTLVKFL